jgi:hypothetical protein
MAAPHVTAAAAMYKTSRPTATPSQVRLALRAAGTLDWKTATDPDSVHEPLLDVSHIVALGDWLLDATPGTSHGAVVGAGGGTVTVPVQLIRAEDATGEVDLSIVGGAPFGASVQPASLVGADGTAASLTFTVPQGTASGSFTVTIRATDGSRVRTSEYPIQVDSDAPSAKAPALRLLTGSKLGSASVATGASWSAASDPGGSIAGYEARWRVDGDIKGPIALGAAAAGATRSTTFGHTYSLRLRARDEAGNWSPWVESGVFRPLLSQTTNGTFGFGGRWNRVVRSWFSGGSTMYATRAGAAIAKAFHGRAVALVASRGPDRGWAQVYVDGAKAGSINLHASTITHRVVVFSARWASPGAHSIRIVVAGSPRHPRVDADALVIVP